MTLGSIKLETARLDGDAGMGLLEILVAIFLIGIISLGIAANTISSTQIVKKTEINYAASNLALSKVELLAAMDTTSLTAANGSTENNLTVPGTQLTFRRVTVVTVNADGSRTIEVTVTSNSTAVPTTSHFKTTLALWS
jgi:Tfp pilus assembly protein PilV